MRSTWKVTAQAGCTWKQVYHRVPGEGHAAGSYPSSYPQRHPSAAGHPPEGIGVGTYKYGSAADNIRDMEVVMPDGTIVNTGFKGVLRQHDRLQPDPHNQRGRGNTGGHSNITFKLTPAPETIKAATYFFNDLESIGQPLYEIAHRASFRCTSASPTGTISNCSGKLASTWQRSPPP